MYKFIYKLPVLSYTHSQNGIGVTVDPKKVTNFFYIKYPEEISLQCNFF